MTSKEPLLHLEDSLSVTGMEKHYRPFVCSICTNPFIASRRDAKCCSAKCRMTFMRTRKKPGAIGGNQDESRANPTAAQLFEGSERSRNTCGRKQVDRDQLQTPARPPNYSGGIGANGARGGEQRAGRARGGAPGATG